MADSGFKVKEIGSNGGSLWRQYANLVVGEESLVKLLKFELVTFLFGNMGGALGLAMRKKFYPGLFGSCGRGVVFGRNMTLRHPHKIRIKNKVIFDDSSVLDAKGENNSGIDIGEGVFVGRNTVIYTKGGDIVLEDRVNIGINCTLYSKNRLFVGEDTMIAAYCYVMSGGQYDYRDPVPFAQQSSSSRGETVVERGCWLGAQVVVVDNVTIGSGTVVGAGSVVSRDLPGDSVATGSPAKVVKGRFS